MPSVSRPAASATALFQLGTAAMDARPNLRAQAEKILRIDGPADIPRPLASTVQSTERRLSRMVGRASIGHGQTSAVHRRSLSADLFPDHAGDLIERLRHWSMELDRRESRLNSREADLNRRLRFLRQCPLKRSGPAAARQTTSAPIE